MKFKNGQWVKVTLRRMDAPDVEFVGKVSHSTPYAVTAECRTSDGTKTFTMTDDNWLVVSITRMTQRDWQLRKGRHAPSIRRL